MPPFLPLPLRQMRPNCLRHSEATRLPSCRAPRNYESKRSPVRGTVPRPRTAKYWCDPKNGAVAARTSALLKDSKAMAVAQPASAPGPTPAPPSPKPQAERKPVHRTAEEKVSQVFACARRIVPTIPSRPCQTQVTRFFSAVLHVLRASRFSLSSKRNNVVDPWRGAKPLPSFPAARRQPL